MKMNLTRQAGRAFTLLELLVVMSIIAILATAGLKGLGAAKNFAREKQAHTDCLNLQLSLENYLTENTRFPTDWSGRLTTKGDFLNTLMGKKGKHNRRATTFFDTGQVSNHPKAHGYIVHLNQFNDPWGTPYRIRLDANDKGFINVPAEYHKRLGPELLGREVFVHSAGRDGDFSTVKDNITSVD